MCEFCGKYDLIPIAETIRNVNGIQRVLDDYSAIEKRISEIMDLYAHCRSYVFDWELITKKGVSAEIHVRYYKDGYAEDLSDYYFFAEWLFMPDEEVKALMDADKAEVKRLAETAQAAQAAKEMAAQEEYERALYAKLKAKFDGPSTSDGAGA